MQKKLPGEIFDYIEKFILSGGQSAAIGMSVGRMLNQDEVVCKHCKTANHKGQKFCSNCGNKLMKECPKCGHDVEDDVNSALIAVRKLTLNIIVQIVKLHMKRVRNFVWNAEQN